LTTGDVHDHVGGRNRDDEVAERHHAPMRGDDVAEHQQRIARSFEVTWTSEVDGRDIVVIHDASGDQRVAAHRHAAVRAHRQEVAAEPDREDTHAGEMQVGE